MSGASRPAPWDATGRPAVRARPDQPAVAGSRDRPAGRVATSAESTDLREWDYGDLEGPDRRHPDGLSRAGRSGRGPWPGGETADRSAPGRTGSSRAARAGVDGDTLLVAHGHLLRSWPRAGSGCPPARRPVRARDRTIGDPRLGARGPRDRDVERGLPPRLTPVRGRAGSVLVTSPVTGVTRARDRRGSRRMATMVTSSAAGISPWKR